MRHHRALIRTAALGLLLALTATLGLVGAPAAQAASAFTYRVWGAGTTTTDQARKLTVSVKLRGRSVARATAELQYLRPGTTTWVKEKTVKISKGKGTVKVRHSVMDRTYRFFIKGRGASASFRVRFVPAAFTIKGSGAGHGVGMSQYGASQLAGEGRSAGDILSTYYPGTDLGTANNNPRTIKVQVLGPPSDSRRTTTLALTTGGFTISDGSRTLATTRAGKPVSIGVKGTLVTARVTLANGTTRNLSAARLTFRWGSTATASVAGAHGSYHDGNLQVTVLQQRPNVVNELAMNTEYLYGIDEVPASWGRAALIAQVVAARTYVIRQAGAANLRWGEGRPNPACDCQVFDDTRSQNFTGWKKAGPAANKPWVDAVKATIHPVAVSAGRPSGSEVDVLWANPGELAETPYFASSANLPGVATGANGDVFAAAQLPYLPSVPDPYSARAARNPYLSWSRVVTQAQLKKALGVTAAIKQVGVVDRYPGGLVKSLAVTLADGATVTITRRAGAWQSALGAMSPWITSISGK